MNLENTDILFEIAEKRELKYVTIKDEDIVKLGKSLDALGRKIRTDYWEESYVRTVFNTVRNYYFSYSTSVQYFNQMLDVDLEDLRIKYRELKVSYPELYPEFLTVAQLIKSIARRDDNPLVSKVKELIRKQRESRVLIVTRRMPQNEELTNFYEIIGAGNENVEFMGEGAFRKTEFVFDAVLFIGSEFYFQPYANNVSKGKTTTFLTYSSFSNFFKDKGLFKGFSGVYSSLYSGVINKLQEVPELEEDIASIEENQEVTTAIIQQFQYSEEEIDYSSEPVDAKVITLESDHIILLETRKNYKIVDPTSSTNKKILTKTVWQMELDDYLLIFNENQSSIISNIADKFIFSEKAPLYRSIQQKWKNRLQKRIDKYGIEKTSKILQEKGVESARPQNLKNWLKETTIIPKDSYNVLVALGYTDNNAEKIIKVCNRILAGHIKAGNMIRRKAEDKIVNSDLRPLVIRGNQKFEIPDLLGATFVVDRIVGIDKANIKVPQSRIMQMYELNSFTF